MFFFLKVILLRIFRPNSRLTFEYRMFNYVNQERKEHGLPKLFFQYDLREVARKHSKDMAKHKYFAHEGRTGTTPKDRFEHLNISEVVAGENLAMIGGYENPVLKAHIGLMNSPGHRANILSNSFNCVGVGVAVSENEVYYFTQNFSFRLFTIKGVRKKLWFAKHLNIKVKRIAKLNAGVILVVKDRNGEELYSKKFDFEGSSLKIRVPIEAKGKHEVYIYNLNDLKLANHFVVTKMI